MPQITAIKPQKNKKRVNIYLDGEFGFGLDLENFVLLNLKVEQQLTIEEVNEIIKKAEFQKYYNKLLNFVTVRPRSEKEVKNWFRKKEVHSGQQQPMLEKLRKLELLDDEKFTRWWIEQRQAFRPKGKTALKAELMVKGINRQIIEKVLSETDIDEVGQAKELIDKKLYRWQSLPEIERKKKITDFLARRGYKWEVIKKVTGSTEIDD